MHRARAELVVKGEMLIVGNTIFDKIRNPNINRILFDLQDNPIIRAALIRRIKGLKQKRPELCHKKLQFGKKYSKTFKVDNKSSISRPF